jgi:aspartyl-tRNA(Asn)/glutamyl-tRNA(Gln) amidotransferase subunit B
MYVSIAMAVYYANYSQQLVQSIKSNMSWLPDHVLQLLTTDFGLTEKDARTLMSFDDGDRVEYFFDVVNQVLKVNGDKAKVGKLVGNW